MADPALLAEAYKRGLLPSDKAAAYEEAVRRGLVSNSFAGGKMSAKGPLGLAAATAATINEAVPFADELSAGVGAVADTLQGKGDFGQNWTRQREMQQGMQAGLRDKSRLASNLATGTGYVIQAVPALATGGAAAAPQAGNIFARVGARAAKNATVGAGYAAANAFASRGTLPERVGSAVSAIPAGAVVGAAVPAAGEAVGAAGRVAARATAPARRTIVRAANNVASRTSKGAFLDPQQEAYRRLGESLRADGFEPQQIQAALTEWNRVGGASPAFMDLISQGGRGQRTMALIRGAAMTGGGRNVATQYGNQVAADLQDNAIARTRQLTPDQRSVPAIEADVQARITQHSQPPAVQPGRGGAAVSARLNERFDQGRAGVNAAYDAVRSSDATVGAPTLTELPGRIRSSLDEALITPETMGSLDPGTRAVLGELDRLSGGARRMDAAAQPNAMESLESGIPTGARGASPRFRLAEIERIRKAMNARLETAKGEDRVALQIAKREFDRWLGEAVDNGAIEGDAAAVDLLRNARRLHAEQQQRFGGNDLVQRLTERDVHGAGRTNLVAPEDASNALLGRSGLSPRLDLHRDLARVRDILGENSAEWQALRQEALGRVLGPDAGTEQYGQRFGAFVHDNPELARLLATPADHATVATSRAGINAAVAQRDGVRAGQGVLNTTPDQYAAGVSAVPGGRPIAQVGAARAIEDAIGRPTEGATGVLNRVGTATNPGRNLAVTFGDEPASAFRQSVRQMVHQVGNARFINPNVGSQTAGRLADETLVEGIPTSKTGLVLSIIRKVQRGATLTDAEREALVRVATSRPTAGVSEAINPFLAPPPPSVSVSAPQVGNVFAIPAHENRR